MGGLLMTEKELLTVAFNRSSLFDGIASEGKDSVAEFAGRWQIKDFQRGEVISEIQNGVDCVGLLVKGSAEVSPRCESAVSILTSGCEFGICNIFVCQGMPTVITARTACKAAFIPKDEFARLLSVNSVLMYRYVRLCNQKMLYLADKLRLMSISGCEARLAYWLKVNQDGGMVRVRPSKDELARRLGMSRASLFRAISVLEKDGIIRIMGETIIIDKPDAKIFNFDI